MRSRRTRLSGGEHQGQGRRGSQQTAELVPCGCESCPLPRDLTELETHSVPSTHRTTILTHTNATAVPLSTIASHLDVSNPYLHKRVCQPSPCQNPPLSSHSTWHPTRGSHLVRMSSCPGPHFSALSSSCPHPQILSLCGSPTTGFAQMPPPPRGLP